MNRLYQSAFFPSEVFQTQLSNSPHPVLDSRKYCVGGFMARIDPDKKQEVPATSISEDGRINPSSPTSGTEGYGMQDGEFSNAKRPGPGASHPDAKGAGDVRKTSYPMPEGSNEMENQSRQDALRDNPNNRQGKEFRCADVGVANCNWSVTGQSDDEIMRKVEAHGREAHGMTEIDAQTRDKIRGAINQKAA
jgi:predicted small metal-binding protein